MSEPAPLGREPREERAAVEEYEKLRPTNAAVRATVFRGGRALLIERGMAAWLEALSTCPPAASRGRTEDFAGRRNGSAVSETSLSPQVYRDAIDVRRGPRLALIRGVARETLSLFPAGTLLLAAGASYCGLSGVVYGLLVLALLEGPTSRRSRAACWGAAAALAAKSAFEYHGGGWLVEGETLEGLLGVVFLPGSHCAGLAGGAAVAFLYAGSLGAASTHAARNARAAASGVTPPKARWAPRVVRPGVW